MGERKEEGFAEIFGAYQTTIFRATVKARERQRGILHPPPRVIVQDVQRAD